MTPSTAGFVFQGIAFNATPVVSLPVAVSGDVVQATSFAFLKSQELAQEPDRRRTALFVGYGIDMQNAKMPLVRVHSGCVTGDVFGSERCECGPQKDSAWAQILAHGCGAIVYLPYHEGRGIGLFEKLNAYALQDGGMNTYEANNALGYDDDTRDYFDAAAVLTHVFPGNKGIALLTNNPRKVAQLQQYGVNVTERIDLAAGHSDRNAPYRDAKVRHGGHFPALTGSS